MSKHIVKEFVYDATTETKYRIGRFLGKGGFARCYELQNCENSEYFACKIIQKASLAKDCHKAKMSQEISIHRSLKHRFVVGFHSYFEDEKCIYLILELCRKRSMMEMLKRRTILTENEVRFYVQQVALACAYLHRVRIIHRDLKLGNLFLNDEMEIKVGDYGLATRVAFDGERKQTLCGTPNYIAPEVLTKQGHSFEVDVWSLGCIMYTLLVGQPPFETPTLRDTYSKIRKSEYSIPTKISKHARALISQMLQLDPSLRPSMEQVLADEFFRSGYIPEKLPVSCLTMPPRFSAKHTIGSKSVPKTPMMEINKVTSEDPRVYHKDSSPVVLNGVYTEKGVQYDFPDPERLSSFHVPKDYYLSQLLCMVQKVLRNMPNTLSQMHEEALDPAVVPFVWVTKWVDYTDKYGIGYSLCDNSVGVVFNDSTRLILLPDGKSYCYIDRNGSETNYDVESCPSSLSKKMTLLTYFCTYMTRNLLKAGAATKPRVGDEFTQVPYLHSYFRTKKAIVFHLTNGTVQMNFFEDHSKIILCPLMGAISFIDEQQEVLSYRLGLIEKYGASKNLRSHLHYARAVIHKLSVKYLVVKDTENVKPDHKYRVKK